MIDILVKQCSTDTAIGIDNGIGIGIGVSGQSLLQYFPPNYPVGATNYPTQSINYPVGATNYPLQTTNYPVGATNYPTQPINYPSQPINYPTQPINYPIGATNYPMSLWQAVHFANETLTLHRWLVVQCFGSQSD